MCGTAPRHASPCAAQPHLTLSVSTYAAQISWWFAHFPRDRFKFITSAELHAHDATPILNEIIEFTGVDAVPFEPSMLRDVWGYAGGYNVSSLSPIDLKAASFLRLYFRQAEADLRTLLAPLGFRGTPVEIDAPLAQR